ncbi:MAG: Fe-S protein assembly chaperone HscA [Planctomycetota bacterium]|nr:Fe-S protein assembly chaperone HscA [Planctomycetota bacterium]MDA0933634.1 Fe-S protein assembly chaperone HscA [Planctomycetota bacterium]
MTAADSPTPNRIVVGIDLGTTNSLAAVVTRHGPRVLRAADGEALLPSVIAFPEDGSTPVVGAEAKARALDLPTRTIHSVKRLLGRSRADVEAEASRLPYPVVPEPERGLARIPIDGRDWSPEELSARVLGAVRARAEAALGMAVEEAVITVPAYFDDAQRQATRHAAELAGLRCLRIVNEPTAASLAYGIDGSHDGTVVVYDLGGGTFDVSVLEIRDGVFKVLATAGDTHLGGDDFDRVIADEILTAAGAHDLVDDAYVKQAIRKSAEALKIELSNAEGAELAIDLGREEQATLRLTRARFEELIAPLVERTIACLRQALRDAERTIDQIDDLVLVGGSTRVPLVRRLVAEATGREPHDGVDPDLAVALGAAIQADILAGGNRNLLLLDVIPLSLGLETMGGVVSKLILRNATIPTSKTEEFSTQIDGQTAVELNIYQGERERTADCRKLASFRLRGIPPMPAGLPRVAVTFMVDADGVLRVHAKEQRTGIAASIQVVPSFGLTQDEVREMMRASIDHAMEDMADREAIELRNKAAAMVHGTRRALELSDLPPDQTYAVKKATNKVDRLLAEADTPADELKRAVDDLSRRTAQIADDVIGSAVHKALTEPREPEAR